jgi:lysophospholipase L1-like esterase
MPHVVLLGDSILDNGAYTSGGPDVVTQLRSVLPAGWDATLAAVDGSVATDVPAQLPQIPREATHLVLSAGGNDALGHIGLIAAPARSAAEVLDQLAAASRGFEANYRAAVSAVLARGLPTTLCTIYGGWSPDASFQRRASTALVVFNDVIIRVAAEHRLTLIELRLICTEAADYANPIEPSSHGGEKIARAIAHAVGASGAIEGTRVIGGADA